MTIPLSNPRLFSSNSFTYFRCPLLYPFSRPAHYINSKPVRALTISSPRRRECGLRFTSRRPSQTTSTSAAIFPKDEKEDWDDGEVADEEEEEEGEEFMPLREMTRWLQNKPAGFGDGMRYDTMVEDKLLEEIKRNQKDRLEGNSMPRASKKENAGSVKKQEDPKVTEVIKTDPKVRVLNLPKKKNIDRDLWKAFKGFSGIISINPAVTGNRKTRDPLCKGFAFIGFESDDAAYRFVQKYSKQNLFFGKIQKQISCDVINNSPESSKSSSIPSPNTSEHRHSGDEVSFSNASDILGMKSPSQMPQNKKDFSVFPNDKNISLSNIENEVIGDLKFNSPMLNYKNRRKIVKRDKTMSLKSSSKRRILGSLAKLKIKDRAVLSGVFSKYGEVAPKEI